MDIKGKGTERTTREWAEFFTTTPEEPLWVVSVSGGMAARVAAKLRKLAEIEEGIERAKQEHSTPGLKAGYTLTLKDAMVGREVLRAAQRLENLREIVDQQKTDSLRSHPPQTFAKDVVVEFRPEQPEPRKPSEDLADNLRRLFEDMHEAFEKDITWLINRSRGR